MAITPLQPVGLDARVLQDAEAPVGDDFRALTVTAWTAGRIALKGADLDAAEWPARLRDALAPRAAPD